MKTAGKKPPSVTDNGKEEERRRSDECEELEVSISEWAGRITTIKIGNKCPLKKKKLLFLENKFYFLSYQKSFRNKLEIVHHPSIF